MKLSDTARVLLSRAAQHPDRLAEPPKHLPAAARDAVVRSLLKNGLLAETPCPREHLALAWRQDEDGAQIGLKVTDAGLRAIGIEPELRNAIDEMELGGLSEAEYEAEQDLAHRAMDASIDPMAEDAAEQAKALGLLDDEPTARASLQAASNPIEARSELPTAGHSESRAPSGPSAPSGGGQAPERPVAPALGQHVPTPRSSALRDAATAILAAWDAEGHAGLDDAVAALRATLTKPTRAVRDPGAPRKPREGTKQQQVLDLLRRAEGASGPAIAEVTGWAPHTVRGFLAGLAKRGHRVEVLDRVRQVGPGKDGAKGSYTMYRIVEAG